MSKHHLGPAAVQIPAQWPLKSRSGSHTWPPPPDTPDALTHTSRPQSSPLPRTRGRDTGRSGRRWMGGQGLSQARADSHPAPWTCSSPGCPAVCLVVGWEVQCVFLCECSLLKLPQMDPGVSPQGPVARPCPCTPLSARVQAPLLVMAAVQAGDPEPRLEKCRCGPADALPCLPGPPCSSETVVRSWDNLCQGLHLFLSLWECGL